MGGVVSCDDEMNEVDMQLARTQMSNLYGGFLDIFATTAFSTVFYSGGLS